MFFPKHVWLPKNLKYWRFKIMHQCSWVISPPFKKKPTLYKFIIFPFLLPFQFQMLSFSFSFSWCMFVFVSFFFFFLWSNCRSLTLSWILISDSFSLSLFLSQLNSLSLFFVWLMMVVWVWLAMVVWVWLGFSGFSWGWVFLAWSTIVI